MSTRRLQSYAPWAVGIAASIGGLILAVWLLSSLMNAIFPGSQYRTSTTSEELVSVTLGEGQTESSLRVPKSYLNWRPNHSGGNHSFLKLAAHWPDMIPMSHHFRSHPPAPSEDLRWLSIYSDELIELKVSAGYNRSRREAIQRALADTPEDFETTSFGLYRYKWTKPRDGKYRALFEAAGTHVQYDNELYITDPSTDQEPVHVVCTLPIKTPRITGRVFCYGRTNLTDRLILEYQFRYDVLPQWRAVDKKSRLLISGMLSR